MINREIKGINKLMMGNRSCAKAILFVPLLSRTAELGVHVATQIAENVGLVATHEGAVVLWGYAAFVLKMTNQTVAPLVVSVAIETDPRFVLARNIANSIVE